ncbi:MAG TPA: antibiotic biosynthesis monooxygenase [Pyrinomonadaceae bacterium]|nr:antibiotic biosynthesis monooxygenase [Pyrinomonadaceae bacterium]
MFIALYRWRLKEGQEEKFREGWRRLTEEIRGRRGSHGSRLHRAADGTWIAYAQWPDRRTWELAMGVEAADGEASEMMSESIEVSQPPVLMEVFDDLLKPAGSSAMPG